MGAEVRLGILRVRGTRASVGLNGYVCSGVAKMRRGVTTAYATHQARGTNQELRAKACSTAHLRRFRSPAWPGIGRVRPGRRLVRC